MPFIGPNDSFRPSPYASFSFTNDISFQQTPKNDIWLKFRQTHLSAVCIWSDSSLAFYIKPEHAEAWKDEVH
jgi:hypothetical protein